MKYLIKKDGKLDSTRHFRLFNFGQSKGLKTQEGKFQMKTIVTKFIHRVSA